MHTEPPQPTQRRPPRVGLHSSLLPPHLPLTSKSSWLCLHSQDPFRCHLSAITGPNYHYLSPRQSQRPPCRSPCSCPCARQSAGNTEAKVPLRGSPSPSIRVNVLTRTHKPHAICLAPYTGSHHSCLSSPTLASTLSSVEEVNSCCVALPRLCPLRHHT